MGQYRVQITDKRLEDMQEIYEYIVRQLCAPESAMKQYNRIADVIEKLCIFPERVKIMESENERRAGIRQLQVDNYSIFFIIKEMSVIVLGCFLAHQI